MAKITYSWEEVDESRRKLDELVDNSDNLTNYPTEFQITTGSVGEYLEAAGAKYKESKQEMDNLVKAFGNFLQIAKISYDDLEAEMQKSMGN